MKSSTDKNDKTEQAISQMCTKIDSQFKGFEPFRYINDVLTINNPNFPNWIPLIYPKDFEIKETKEQTSFV
jgi:hypothetical protein